MTRDEERCARCGHERRFHTGEEEGCLYPVEEDLDETGRGFCACLMFSKNWPGRGA